MWMTPSLSSPCLPLRGNQSSSGSPFSADATSTVVQPTSLSEKVPCTKGRRVCRSSAGLPSRRGVGGERRRGRRGRGEEDEEDEEDEEEEAPSYHRTNHIENFDAKLGPRLWGDVKLDALAKARFFAAILADLCRALGVSNLNANIGVHLHQPIALRQSSLDIRTSTTRAEERGLVSQRAHKREREGINEVIGRR